MQADSRSLALPLIVCNNKIRLLMSSVKIVSTRAMAEAKVSPLTVSRRLEALTPGILICYSMLTLPINRSRKDPAIRKVSWVRIRQSTVFKGLLLEVIILGISSISTLKQRQALRINRIKMELPHSPGCQQSSIRVLWYRTRIIPQRTQLHFWTKITFRSWNSRYWLTKRPQISWWRVSLHLRSDIILVYKN